MTKEEYFGNYSPEGLSQSRKNMRCACYELYELGIIKSIYTAIMTKETPDDDIWNNIFNLYNDRLK